MANPVYPATNNAEAVELNIYNANQFFTVLNGGIDASISTYEGNGDIPSIAKALNEAAAYKTPLDWATSGEETDLLQPRLFENGLYIPLKVPAPFAASPSSSAWRLAFTSYAASEVFNTILEGESATAEDKFFMVPTEGGLTLYQVVLGVAEFKGTLAGAGSATLAENAANFAVSKAAEAFNSASDANDSEVQAGVYKDQAEQARDAAAAVVTGGTATIVPEAGKIPLADGDGNIDLNWLDTTTLREAVRD